MRLAPKLLPIAILCCTSLASAATGAVTVTLREAATATGRVTLGDVARVDGDFDRTLLDRGLPVGDGERVDLPTVLRLLTDAGVRPDRLLVNGPAACQVTLVAAPVVAPAEDDEWGTLAAASATGVAANSAVSSAETLVRERIAAAVAMPMESITVVGRTPLPATAVAAEPVGAASLGSSTWRLHLPDGTSQSVRVDAAATITSARLARPVSRGSIVRPEDLETVTRTVTREDTAGVSPEAAVGQRAARDLLAGGMLARRDLAAPMLVKRGQMVVVTLNRGGVVVRTLAKSAGDAGFGEVVACRVEATGESVSVVVTGPQAGSIAAS